MNYLAPHPICSHPAIRERYLHQILVFEKGQLPALQIVILAKRHVTPHVMQSALVHA